MFGSEAKSKYVMHLLLIKYSRCSTEQLLQLSHANVDWLVCLTVEVDWSPKVIPNSLVSSDVRRTWPTERELWLRSHGYHSFTEVLLQHYYSRIRHQNHGLKKKKKKKKPFGYYNHAWYSFTTYLNRIIKILKYFLIKS